MVITYANNKLRYSHYSSYISKFMNVNCLVAINFVTFKLFVYTAKHLFISWIYDDYDLQQFSAQIQ